MTNLFWSYIFNFQTMYVDVITYSKVSNNQAAHLLIFFYYHASFGTA